jgi:hypothetical protein
MSFASDGEVVIVAQADSIVYRLGITTLMQSKHVKVKKS